MRTTTLLTEAEINILKQLKQPNEISIKGLLIVGSVLSITGIIFGLLVLSAPILLIFASFFFIPGIILIVYGLRQRKKYHAYFNMPAHGHQKQIVTDQLLRAELIDRKLIRYHFTNYHLDLYIASGTGYHPAHFSYKRIIDDIVTLTHIPVKLSYVEFDPGVNILLDIRYDQYSLREDVVPVEEKDRKKIIRDSASAVGCLFGVAVVISLILAFATGFKWEHLWLILTFGAGPILLIGLGIVAHGNWVAKTSTHKIVIYTTVTEVLGLQLKNGKRTERRTFYRLGDGSLMHISPLPFKPGDNVLIQFMQTHSGKRGMLIEMVAVP